MLPESIPDTVITTSEKLRIVCRTKVELYYFLSTEGNVFLPPVKTIDTFFLKQILNGEKKDQVKRAYVPQFPGLGVEDFMKVFSTRVPITDYLPQQKPVLKIPRNFILDVLRTLAGRDFDGYVKDAMTLRQSRYIEKTNQTVNILRNFAEKLETTPLCSTKNGKAHMILKASSRPRKRMLELSQERTYKEEEKANIRRYTEMEAVAKSKRWKLEDFPAVMKQNEDIKVYLQGRGIMDDNGNMKV